MYLTTANVAARLGRELTADEVTVFSSVIGPAVDAIINKATNTQFGNSSATDVYVEEDDSSTIIIPTMHDITKVAFVTPDNVETVIPTSEYYLYPRHGDDKQAIRHWNGRWTGDWYWRRNYHYGHYTNFCSYKISGQLGYKDVPADILGVALELALMYIQSNTNFIKMEKVGDWWTTYKDSVDLSAGSMQVLANYNRLSRSM